MKPNRTMLMFLGVATLAAIALIVREVRAADKDDITKIAVSLKAGKADAAEAGAKAYAKKTKDDLEDLMSGFGKKGLMPPDGIEKKLIAFAKVPPAPADFANANYKEIGATTAAIAAVCEVIPAPKSDKGDQKQWVAFSKDLREKGMKFQTAFATNNPAAAKAAAVALGESCTKCHVIFR